MHGWAGYDARVDFLPPEHFLAMAFREALVEAFRGGELDRQGPDGKLLVRLREESSLGPRTAPTGPTGLLGDRWILEHVLVTLQHLGDVALADLAAGVDAVLSRAYGALAASDRRWERDWRDVRLLVNPNGPLLNGGSDGDNGQTGRKLVMDYYGPRVPIGGGAIWGKDPTHIDRAGAAAAREAAVRAVEAAGAGEPSECLVTVMYAPNLDDPLDVRYLASAGVRPEAPGWFAHSAVRGRGAQYFRLA